jgi:hypothetical protein
MMCCDFDKNNYDAYCLGSSFNIILAYCCAEYFDYLRKIHTFGSAYFNLTAL